MNNYGKTKDEKCELFKRAISEAMDLKMQEIDEEIKNVELPPQSQDHKTQVNRLFCESTEEDDL